MDDRPHVEVFDTTLRDGEQTPQLAFTIADKLAIAAKLDELGVAVIEAGFPANSEDEAEAVHQVAQAAQAEVCAIARVVKSDLETTLATGVGMVDVFCSTSEIQMEHSLRMTREQVMAASLDAVRMVKDAGRRCMFTPMDATRTDVAFLDDICAAAVEAGAEIIGLTDTVGVGTPESVAAMVDRVAKAAQVQISIHCHDDFGLATANTVAGVRAGATMVQTCINGLGERAGNAATEEVVMALKGLYGIDCGLDTTKLFEASRVVERISGVGVPRNKPVVGANAFTHESGIHAAGVMRDRATFEPGLMTPEMVGHRRQMVVGKHTGRHGIAQALAESGLEPNREELDEILGRVHAVAAKGKQLMSMDLFAIAETVMQKMPSDKRTIVLDQLVVTTGDKVVPTASLHATVEGVKQIEAAVGMGPVDAAFQAVKSMIKGKLNVEIADYHVDAITGGSEATVRVAVTVEDQRGRQAFAQAAHVDIVMASMDALITAINHLMRQNGNGVHAGDEGNDDANPA